MILETSLIVVCALMVGIAAGLLPGIGLSLVIISAYPLMSYFSIPQIFLFYVVVDSTMQYYGSISSIIFGVLGETTSAPAVENGHALFRAGHGNYALGATATSSFIASLFGIAIFYLCSIYSSVLIVFLTGKVKVVILTLVLGVLVSLSKTRWLAFALALVGLMTGSSGSDIVTWAYAIFPRYSIFDGGIPLAPLLSGFIAIPLILEYMRTPLSVEVQKLQVQPVPVAERIRYLFNLRHFASTLRGSIVGCVAGAIPGVSYTISSNMAEAVEKFINKRDTSIASLSKNLLAAEAANNSGAIVVLAPLLLFALPIVPSEAILLSAVEARGFSYTTGLLFITENLPWVILAMFSINLINWVMSGYCYKYVADVYCSLAKYGYYAALAICVLTTLAAGYSDNQLLFSFEVLVVASLCGMMIKDVTTKLCFVFGFFVAAEYLPELYRLYLIFQSTL